MKDLVFKKILKKAKKNNKIKPYIQLNEAIRIRSSLFVDEYDLSTIEIIEWSINNKDKINLKMDNEIKKSSFGEKIFKDRASKDRFKYFLSMLLISISLLWCLYSGYISFLEKDNGIFFQRSGAILVLFCALGEYILGTIAKVNIVSTTGINIAGLFTYTTRFLPSKYYILIFVNMLCILLGTIIWGYGDIWLQKLQIT